MNPLLQAVKVMAGGKLLFAIQDVIIKQMSGAYPIHQIMTIRGLVALLSYLVWTELPDAPTLVGIAVIVASGIYVLRREWAQRATAIAAEGLGRHR